jgi:hypothetical protein
MCWMQLRRRGELARKVGGRGTSRPFVWETEYLGKGVAANELGRHVHNQKTGSRPIGTSLRLESMYDKHLLNAEIELVSEIHT